MALIASSSLLPGTQFSDKVADMSFIQGLCKTAAEHSEVAEAEKYGKIEKAVLALPSPDKKPGAKDVKEGTRVCYISDTGWKQGPRGSHTKPCSVDAQNRPMKQAYEEELKRHGISGLPMIDQVQKKYPGHHDGEWKNEAVHIGDEGTITKVVSKKSGPNDFYVTWDKHPNCEWGRYTHHDLKLIPKKSAK